MFASALKIESECSISAIGPAIGSYAVLDNRKCIYSGALFLCPFHHFAKYRKERRNAQMLAQHAGNRKRLPSKFNYSQDAFYREPWQNVPII